MNFKHLIIGGARSGKSSFAEQKVVSMGKQLGKKINYVATATGEDDEMIERIAQHQAQREHQFWTVVEEPILLGSTIAQYDSSDIVLIDCLTLWLSNCLHTNNWQDQRAEFLTSLKDSHSTIFMVSNEVGHGIVPLGEINRRFVDESGWLHQELALLCDAVTMVSAGIPLPLKQS